MKRYRVDVTNQPRREFTEAAEAIKYGAGRVYLYQPHRFAAMLEAGHKVEWTYGFASVECTRVSA